LLDDPEIGRLARLIELEEDPEFSRAYPGEQGSEVIVTLRGGRTLTHRMHDLVPATADQIRARFRRAAGPAAEPIEAMVDTLDQLEDAGSLGGLLGSV